MRLKNKIITIGTLVFLFGCAGDRGREFYQERMDRTSKIEVMLKTITEVAREDDNKTFDQIGYGFIVGNYIYSRNHVTSKVLMSKLEETPFGVREVNIEFNREKIINEQTFLDDLVLYPVIENPEKDLSIFDLSKQPELCKKYCNNLTFDDLMTEKDLYQGMRVYWNSSPIREGYYRESLISKLRDEKDKDSNVEDTYTVQDRVVQGSSGKPVWNEDKIAGIVHFVWKGFGGIGFMDGYIKEIKNYESKQNLNKDELQRLVEEK